MEAIKNRYEFVVLFDVENPEKEVCDPQRLKLIEELSYKLSPTSDAKLAYAEKRILQEERGAQVSFKNLQKIFERLNSKKSFRASPMFAQP